MNKKYEKKINYDYTDLKYSKDWIHFYVNIRFRRMSEINKSTNIQTITSRKEEKSLNNRLDIISCLLRTISIGYVN
jgi:hypothetical protein